MKKTHTSLFAINLILLFTFSSCSTKEKKTTEPVAPPALNQPTALPEPEKTVNEQISELVNKSKIEKFSDTLALDVYFVTNRDKSESVNQPCSNEKYSISAGAQAHYGVCRVNVPKKHITGKIESSRDPRSDSHRFFRIINEKKLDFDDFQKNIQNSRSKEVLIFVHGFNVKFEEAVYRASQIAYDLKFQGSIILFSWPAGAGNGFLDSTLVSRTYEQNKKNAKNSIAAAVDFFDLISRLELRNFVYVHSMGHQVVIPALVELSKNTEVKLLVHELILNAPDYDLKEFENMAPSLRKLARRITLYCSYNDTAMLASETINGGSRLGACQSVEGVDVINVSEIDNPTFGLGHGYYSSRAVLSDVAQLILGYEAENRLFIRLSEPNSTENYYLRP